MSEYPIQACQNVEYSTGLPQTETDDFGVTLIVAPEQWKYDEQCATALTEETAQKALRDVIDGFCSVRQKCHAIGEIETSEVLPLGERIARFFASVFESTDRVLREHQRVTGKSIWSNPKY